MRRLGEEAGQSLVELLVTLALGLVVLTATLATFESFNSTARSTDAVVDVQDQARSQLDRLTRDVRGALPPVAGADAIVVPAATSPAAAVQSDELVVGRVTDTTAGTTAMVLRRWCVASGTLWREDLAGPTTTAGAPCPSTTGAVRLLRGTPLTGAPSAVFSLDAARTTVGIRLDLAAQTRPGRTVRAPLRTAVRLRTTTGGTPSATVTQTCPSSGRGLLTVTTGSATGADAVVGSSLSVGGTIVGSTSAVIASPVAGTAVDVTVRSASGAVSVLHRTLVACP